MPAAARVVFDTNVLLSLFVFADSRFSPLRGEVAGGRWLALTNAACFAEFRRVLGYPQFALVDSRRETVVEAYRGLACFIDIPPTAADSLPKCRDRDDQKFLELARGGNADWLVTADRALLKLRHRQRLAGLFQILTPDETLAKVGPGGAAT